MRKKFLLRGIALLLSLLMISSLSGCTDNTLKETNVLKMYDPTKSKEDTYSVTKLLRDEFSVKYPDVGLDITEATYNFDRAIFSGGSLPDEAGYELQTWYDQLGVSIMKGGNNNGI